MTTLDTFKIYCGNLSPITTSTDLQNLFSKYGTVVEADVITGKNYGFVHMATESEGMNVLMSLQGHILNGEKMNVQRAINSKRATSSTVTIKRPTVGQGVGSLDDFDSVYEINETNSYNNDSPNVLKQQQQSVSTSSPSHYPLPINSSLSNNSSGRPSPLLLSSGSSTSYTPEHVLPHRRLGDNKVNIENLTFNEDKYCGICHEEYNSVIHVPKILSCNHTFCSDCLSSLTNGFEIKCPLRCPYITSLQDTGVSGLTTNQTKIFSHDETLTCMPTLQDNRKNQESFEQDVCCVCLCTPPGKLCAIQKHQTLRETEAFKLLKLQLSHVLDLSMNTLRTVMSIQATLKDRMQYTLHSLNKFSEELKLKIEGEELEQKMQQSLLVDLHDLFDTLNTVTNINDVLQKYSKVSASYQNIYTKFRHCYAKDSVNSALQSIMLELKDPFPESLLSNFGLSYKEAFSLASTLKDNADKGNFANVLLIYLLSDLLFTRYRPHIHSSYGLSPFSHSFGSVNPPTLNSLQEDIQESDDLEPDSSMPDTHEIFDINKVLETTKAIESNVMVNGSTHPHLNDEEEDRFSPPIVSSALSLGLSNFSLIGSNNKSLNEELQNNNVEQDKDTPRPVSYLDAVKKPAKQVNNSETSTKQVAKTSVPSPMKPSTKFPHCWMVLSINGINAGRIVFQLRPDKAPNMCDNFIGLCTGRSGYGYKGTHFFKNGDGFLVGGDVENDDGTGGYSVYDKQKFEADLCPLKDDVGMVRFKGIGTSDKGRGMVGSQFMIWYTEREFKKFSFSLVFGKVVDGLEIVQEAANHNLHKVAIKVEECGAI